MPLRVSRISATADLLGESPVWDCARQRLYWVDGVSRRVHGYEPASGATYNWAVPSTIGSVALGQSETLIVALVDGIYRLDLVTGAVTPLFQPAPADPRIRFNDGKMDRHGRFLCGSMGVHADPLGQLFRIDAAGGGTPPARRRPLSETPCFRPPGGATDFFAR